MTQATDVKPSEGGSPAIDLSKYIPKEDHEKALSSTKTEMEKLKQELDDAKLSLLDPEYISYLEQKKSGAERKEAKIEAKLADGDQSKSEIAELRRELSQVRQFQQDVAAVLELQAVEKKYEDFNDLRDDVKKVLESSSTALTIEQAYLLAKAKHIGEKSDEDKVKSAKTGREKPGATVPAPSLEPTNFKDKRAAAEDAWDKIVGAGKDTL